jgi:hypothetical protein
MDAFESFEGMSQTEVRFLVQEAMTVHQQAQIDVLSRLVEHLLRKTGSVAIDEFSVEHCIKAKTLVFVEEKLRAIADADAAKASRISDILKSLDFYKTPPAA